MSTIYNHEHEWIEANKNFYWWYYQTYPFLKNFTLPISTAKLEGFYIDDIKSRNFKPVQAIVDSYELLFSYFIANYPEQNNPNRFSGKTTFEYVVENIPKAVNKTFSDIGNFGSSITNTIIIILILAIIFLVVLKK